MPEKQRLDILLAERGLVESRELARRLIMEGHVTVSGQRADKPGTRVALDAELAVRALPRFVSRGGEKLDAALIAFKVDVAGLICTDVGASTGGFTDCLLQRGAAKVYAIDVGYGQLDYRLRRDERVIVMERTNARYVESLPEHPALAVIDASFISLKLLLPVVKSWMLADGRVVALIKPQFEVAKNENKKGIVRDVMLQKRVCDEITAMLQLEGWQPRGVCSSPILGGDGNREFLICAERV